MGIVQQNLRGGVIAYLEACKDESKAKTSLKRSLSKYAIAREKKYNALNIIMPELDFLKGNGRFDPGLNSDYVIPEMIMRIIDSLDTSLYEELAKPLLEETK